MRFLYLFSLASAVLLACGSAPGTGTGVSARSNAGSGNHPPDGKHIFSQYCVACHGADGKLGFNGAKDLSQSVLNLEERVTQIAKGKNLMTAFEDLLSPAEIRAVAEYTLTLKQ